MKLISACFPLLLTVSVCDAARILAVIPIFAKSHHYAYHPIIKALAEKGHNVTFYTGLSLGRNYTNIKEIEIHSSQINMFNKLDFKQVLEFGKVPVFGSVLFWPLGLGVVEYTLTCSEIQDLIHSNDEYDLILLETHFGQESLLAFGHKFKAPVVSLSSLAMFTFTDEFIGNPFAISYVPGFELPYNHEMTFMQRCHNNLRAILTLLYGYYSYLPTQDNLMRKYFNYSGAETIPPLIEMIQNVALVITSGHIAIDYPRLLVPNIIEVAGLHIATENKPLPKELKDFLDNSEQGVVYVSFGSLVPADKMPIGIRDTLINAFKKLKQNVLWKIPIDLPPELPNNIKLSKWLPQQDVLAHPNLKVFMTHGGLLSQQEAVYYGVPLIGVPFFGDQGMNVKRAEKQGFSVYLDPLNMTEESISWALNEVLNNPKYKENIDLRSKLFRDNPEPPVQKAIYWIEYVLRHNGALHLRTNARKMPYWKYLLLDVFAFLGLILLMSLFTIYMTIRFVFSLFSKENNLIQTNKKNN